MIRRREALEGASSGQPSTTAAPVGAIVVLPGHSEQTSIGRERATNPFLLALQRGDGYPGGTAGRITRGL